MPPAGAPGAHPIEVVEDASECVRAAARQWPNRFEAIVSASPKLRRDSNVVRALASLHTPESETILVEAAQVREAGNGYLRAAAVASLVARDSRALTALLPRLLGDRHDAVRRAALDAAHRYGDARSLVALHRIAANPRGKPWERAKASGATTKINRRSPQS
ncbi:HEAT repeat-containing protein [Asanoa hainanensis]|uniref:HEAT repeat-containing protein n=1 Tax=Asanoa hainanensis TaxID=560556 RepID=A0A239NXZ8_9ACTN|nr:HEAT repeat domain-containing protein [Asanoa hainanensis]SNT59716.1 HEAT repeat-containing protein [Asanoa hainanensis]